MDMQYNSWAFSASITVTAELISLFTPVVKLVGNHKYKRLLTCISD